MAGLVIHVDDGVMLSDLEGALCADHEEPQLWDPDAHHHDRLGKGNSCWMCLDSRDVCMECPVIEACFSRAQERRESYMIYAGHFWTAGRPRDVRLYRR